MKTKLLVGLLVVLINSHCTFGQVNESDSLALLALYHSTDGSNWTNPWDLTQPVGSWDGVNLSSGRVRVIKMGSNNLNGPLPPEIGNLSALEDLELPLNNLTGPIPAEIGNLSNLLALTLYNNQLSGPLPEEIGSLSSLGKLALTKNKISGSIPPSIGNLTELQYLFMGYNDIGGAIPPEIGNLTKLRHVNLSDCKLSGELPQELGLLQRLSSLNLNRNVNLTGHIPVTMVNVLAKTQLQKTGICSPIYESLVVWADKYLSLPGDGVNCAPFDTLENEKAALIALYNKTSGIRWHVTWKITDPVSTWHGVKLDQEGRVMALNLTDNNLIREMPGDLKHLKRLVNLNLSRNELRGPLPAEIGELSALKNLELHFNDLTGPIPAEIGNLTNLQTLILYQNQLSGPLPQEIGGLSSLKVLALTKNQISGSIPPSIGNLTQLERLFLGFNDINGTIPPQIGNLTQLKEINLTDCDLSGELPQELGLLVNLEYINLDRNFELSGHVPVTMINTNANMFMWRTNICDPIYESLWEWAYGGNFDLSGDGGIGLPGNGFNCNPFDPLENEKAALIAFKKKTKGVNWDVQWKVTDPVSTWHGVQVDQEGLVRTLKLGDNNLQGEIPEDLKHLERLANLDLSRNNLTGNIPELIGDLSKLKFLSLYNNALTGTLPEELGNLNELISLSVTRNNLSGSLPSSLSNLSSLEFLILRENNFNGQIPSEYGNLTSLRKFWANGNALNGELPATLSNLQNMVSFEIHDNPLSGSIPLSYTNLDLTTFNFAGTDLCEPPDQAFQDWINQIYNLKSTGLICEETNMAITTLFNAEGNINLNQHYPNPATDYTTIPFYSNTENKLVQLRVFNQLGEEVMANKKMFGEGYQALELDVRELPSGIYYYTLNINNFDKTRKLIIHR
ncbi:MAG: T9SS type A sorting domain-containing protein [Bacteroidota bacterium]